MGLAVVVLVPPPLLVRLLPGVGHQLALDAAEHVVGRLGGDDDGLDKSGRYLA